MDDFRHYMSTIHKRFDTVESKILNLENKIDNHLERVSRNEEAIRWLKGHVKIVTILATGIVVAIIPLIINGFKT